MKTANAFVAIGSNSGNSQSNVKTAIQMLEALSEGPVEASSLWETTPVDCPPGSAMFVNAAVRFVPKARATPEKLLLSLQAMERAFGRQRKVVLNEPRPLDLDLIAFGDEVRATPELTLPHPRAHLRRFVLEPLSEIAPELVLPGQTQTVAELLRSLPPDETVRRM